MASKMCLEVTLISRYDWHFIKNDCEVHVLEMSSKCFQNVFKVSLVCLPDEERVGQIERENKSDLKNIN